ncbi:MAG: HEAT repeat domain-containing protein [Gammaproteobacteria bacterium]
MRAGRRLVFPVLLAVASGCFQEEAPRPAPVAAPAGDPEISASKLAVLAEQGATAEIRAEAVYAMTDLGRQSDPGAVAGALADPDPEVRRAAIVALTGFEGEVSASLLAEALNDSDVRVRRDATEALGEVGGPAARQALHQALYDPDPGVREIAAEMLEEVAAQH